jgi:hypothetical protein
MSEGNSEVLRLFKANVDSVRQLVDFDRYILDSAIYAMKSCYEKLKNVYGIDNAHLVPQNTVKDLQNIRQHDSLRPKYEEMFNQCIVLLVSHFAYSLEELFRANIRECIQKTEKPSILSEEIRFTIKEIQDTGYNMLEQTGEWLMANQEEGYILPGHAEHPANLLRLL